RREIDRLAVPDQLRSVADDLRLSPQAALRALVEPERVRVPGAAGADPLERVDHRDLELLGRATPPIGREADADLRHPAVRAHASFEMSNHTRVGSLVYP